MPSRPNQNHQFNDFENFDQDYSPKNQTNELEKNENLLLEDGYYKQKTEKVLPFGNKVSYSKNQYQNIKPKNRNPNFGKSNSSFGSSYLNTDSENIDNSSQSQDNFDNSNSANSNRNFNQKRTSANFENEKLKKDDLKSLRKRNAFNWQKVSRNFAILGIFLLILGILTTGTAFAWYTYQYNNAPNIAERLNNFEESSVIYANDGKTRIFELFGRKAGDGKRENITIDRVPKSMQLATIAIEDRFFYYNADGIPWQNIAGAIVDCILGGFKGCRGGSGLSQQLVKNVTGDDNASSDRKIRELFTAIKMNREGGPGGREISKDDVLTAYLNIAFFSRNAFGVQQASRAFYGHDIDAKDDKGEYRLTPPKACYLAGLVQSPTTYGESVENKDGDVWRTFEKRKNDCLDIMAGKKYTNDKGERFNIQGDGKDFFIKDDTELDKWKTEKVDFVVNKNEDPYPHFRGYVQQEIIKFLDSVGLPESALYTKGLKIVTTLDPTIQKKTEEIVKNNADKIRSVGGDNASAMVLDGPSGSIVAMVGSLDYNNEKIKGKVNIATTPQQPGSSIKPYVYASAFNQGFNPGTILMDSPTNFEGFKPNNFAKDFKGPVSIHYALSNSRNIPAVKGLFLSAGTERLDGRSALNNWFDFDESTGLRFPCQVGDKDEKDAAKNCENTPETGKDALYRNRCFYGSAIGGCEVTMVSHITGINTLLQEGNLSTATPFKSITDKNGVDLFTLENRSKLYPKTDKKIDPTIARQITQVMSDQNRIEFGQFKPLFTIKDWLLAGKTGTTDGNRDTWMVGGSPLYTTTVWAGRTDNGEMAANVQASNLALPMWNEIQQMLHKDQKPKAFSTEGLKQIALDPMTGFLSGGGGTNEWLNDKQIKLLQEAGARIARPEYDPRTKNIFQNRSTVVAKKFRFNKLDGKIAVEGKTLEENIEEKVCMDYLGEFPESKGWSDSIVQPKSETRYVKKDPKTGEETEVARTGCTTGEKSDQDQVGDKSKNPEITNDNDIRDNQNGVGELKATFKSPVDSKKIVKAYIKVNGKTVKTYEDKEGTSQITLVANGNDFTKDLDLFQDDKTTVTFETEDSTGKTKSQIINNVSFAAGKKGNPNNSNNSSNSNNSNNSNSQTKSQENSKNILPSAGIIQTPSNLSTANGSTILSISPNKDFASSPTLIITQNNKTTSCQAILVAGNYLCGVNIGIFQPGVAIISVKESEYNIPDFSVNLK